jgi:hypothetical protein
MGECVAGLGRACSWCNLRCSTQSPWAFALPSLILDVVADGGLSADIGFVGSRRRIFFLKVTLGFPMLPVLFSRRG